MNYWLVFGVVSSLLVVWRIIQSKAAKKKLLELAKQEAHHRPEALLPGGGTPVFHGIRVVELSTVIAAPTIAMAMGELGAEVVKIEEPKGDFWRNFLMDYQTGTATHSDPFEAVNTNKSSVVLDLKKESAVAQLKDILKNADVFITNVRNESLMRMNLHYEAIRDEMPHLVYAHLNAWGRGGPDAGLPGYDIGAFWAMSGLAAATMPEGHYQTYPIGVGDCTTGMSMTGGVATALTHRLKTGQGQLVEGSLYRLGTWCATSILMNDPNNSIKPQMSKTKFGGNIPDYAQFKSEDPVVSGYVTEDKRNFYATASGDDETLDKIRTALCEEFDVDPDVGSHTVDELREKIAQTNSGDLIKRLTSAGVPFERSLSLTEAVKANGPEHEAAGVYASIDGVKELARVIALPVEFSCSKGHSKGRAAPNKGAHTHDFLENGWARRKMEAELPKDDHVDLDSEARMALEDVVVVEWSSASNTVAGATCHMADLGATVLKAESTSGDVWRKRDKKVFDQLNRGKQSVVYDEPSEILGMLKGANVFVTNVSEEALADAGLDIKTVRQKYPKIIYCLVTPYGTGAPNDHGNEISTWWAKSGLAACMTVDDPAPIVPLFAELMMAEHVFCGVQTAVFHQQRTGEGQVVSLNLLRSGYFSWNQLFVIGVRQIALMGLWSQPVEVKHDHFPVPTANCVRTKDGKWVQMLGIDFKRHLGNTVKTLGLVPAIYLKLVLTVVFKVLPARKPIKLFKFFPLFALLNREITAACAEMTWEEMVKTFDEKDIWYCPINTPSEVLHNRQAREAGNFVHKDGKVFMGCPINMSCSDRHGPQGPAPKLS